MKNKALVALAVAIIVIGGLYFLSPDEAAAPTPEEETTTTQEGAEETTETVEENAEANEEEQESEPVSQTQKTIPQQPVVAAPSPAPQPEPKPVVDYAYNKTIIYEGGRFVPNEVDILVGGTIRFVNVSDDTKMWIASAPHPTHVKYSIVDEESCSGYAFDQCEAIGKGESWSFTFEKLGSFGFHNHVRAQDTGEVHVLTQDEYDTRMIVR